MTKNKSYNECLENIALTFDKMRDNQYYMREQLYEFKEEDKIYMNFRECFIAISPNGGLIAIFKKKGYLDTTKNSKINKFIIVMYQTAKKKYLIPIDLNFKLRYFILFDFNEKEQLYGLCNDGSIFKIDILIEKAVEKISSQIFKTENIVKAKLYEEGFIALTTYGNFYYVKDIKNPIPELFFQMKTLLRFSNNIDFLIIPSQVSKSGNIELLITNEKGSGAIHVEKCEDARYFIMPIDESSKVFAYKGISIIKKDKLEPYIIGEEILNITNTDKKVQEGLYQHENLRKIAAFAISPSKKNLAIYDTRGYVFFFDSTLDLNLDKNPRKKVMIKMDKDVSQKEVLEQQVVINFEEGFQFLFCGEDAVILSGSGLIFLVYKHDHSIMYRISDSIDYNALKGRLFCKCISEVDGVRYITNEGIFFISHVNKELFNICSPFSNNYSKKLIQAYQDYVNKSVNSDKSLRKIGDDLIKAVISLGVSAANIFWVEDLGNKRNEKKDIQLFILKAAQYGKIFVNKDEFNYDKFLNICKDIRCVNNLRNHSTMPRLITFNEYKSLEPKDLIKKLLRNLNFGMAFEISHYLDYSDKRVYQRFAIAKIKKLSNEKNDDEKEQTIFNYLNERLKNVQNFSFIQLAKKAFKYHLNTIGMKLLEYEKSALSKLPQYIELMQWEQALSIAENFYDFNIINTVLYKIYKKEKGNDFINIVSNYPKVKYAVIQFLNNNNEYVKMNKFLKVSNNPEELFFFYLEQYFQAPTISDRQRYISLAKDNLKLIDNTINPNFEHKFYKNYLESLENNLTIKLDPKSQSIFSTAYEISSDICETPFDISVYDFYKIIIKYNKDDNSNSIETLNKNIGFPQEGMNIMKLLTYGENKWFNEIISYLNKNPIKKIGLTNLNVAEILYKFKQYDKAFEYIKLINEKKYIDYKIEMMDYLYNYEGKLEIIISDKNIENKKDLINDILKIKPELKLKADELNEKYKK